MMRRLLGVFAVAVLMALGGCGGFFSDPNTTTSSTGSTTGDYIYVVNAATDSLSGFSLASGSLVNVATSAYGLTSGLSPASAVVSRADTFVFVGGNEAIYCYSIGTGGVLTAVSGAGTTTTGDVVSMATSPDGQWLLALSNSSTATGAVVTVYGINTSTGVLTAQSTVSVTFNSGVGIGTVVPHQIKIASTGDYAAVSLGTAGDAFFTFTTSTGVLVQTVNVVPAATSGNYLSDNSIAFNPAGTELFIGTTGQVSGGSYISAYPITSAGLLGTVQTISTGNSPASLETDSTGAYLYSANVASGTITGYTISSAGALAAMTNSPFATSAGVTALVRDQSGDYLVAVSEEGGTTTTTYDVTLYAFDKYTAGQLDAISTSASGTDPAGSIAVAATH
jgi:6-phosphogluconolactonase